ncbi:Replication factor C subunit 1 [Penicillium waksmanii]|uniref:Replication factor C subunit 1 n=1 Tax=Penicillium waksmanii TaxID=69791 RepID=UPI002547A0AF|nr:Replication factor C subunit 1 [Penicillium waksmanii]KAJ5974517.1 Replication factor C subunit 1 [Penicillium waksmanii]
MPPDIRSFFGGKPPSQANGEAPKPAKKEVSSGAWMHFSTTKEAPLPSEFSQFNQITDISVQNEGSISREKETRKVVDDSDDDEAAPVKPATPKPKPKAKPKPEEPKGEVTTTSDYFASSKKRGQTTKSPSTTEKAPEKTASPEKAKRVEIPSKPSRTSKKATTVVDDDGLGGDDIFASEYAKAGKGDDAYVAEGDSDDDDDDFEVLEVKPAAARARRTQNKRQIEDDEDDDVVMEDLPKTTPKPRATRKRKQEALTDEDEELPKEKKKRAPAKATVSPAAKKTKASPKKKEPEPENPEIQAIFDSIPLIRAPSPPPKEDGPAKKWTFGGQRSRTPPVSGTKDVPQGADNCLAGLTFVFTGVLESLGRDEGAELVKRYGGKVTGAPSRKTNYVVLGGEAGPKKLETIQNFKLKTINEDGLFELIRRLPVNGGSGQAAAAFSAKQKAEEEKVKALAAEIDAEEKKQKTAMEKEKARKATPQQTPSKGKAPVSSQESPVNDQLWTTKYAPTAASMICGNKTAVERIQTWLRNWHSNAKKGFKTGGKDGSGIYRAVMIHGPPGIGKTTAAHLMAKVEGFDIVETNASDTRSKKLVETGLLGVLDTTSLQGYFAGEGKKVDSGKRNLVLIMDEVDGMSAGDRGGVGAVAAIVKKTNIPVILICNERRLPKMRPFDHVTFDIPFRRPTVEQIRARLSTICFREGIQMPRPVLDSLIEGTHADIRQVINMLSAAKLDQSNMDHDKGKQMSKAWEKHIILKPWDIVSKILSAQMFSPSSNSSLEDKAQLYFNDHEFSYLMLQEHYLKTKPTLASNCMDPREKKLKELELIDNAASSISDGDLVDRMIHGTQQQWSLMPTHAMFSFVRPASFVYGNSYERPAFTSWLGNNSKQGKLTRFVKEIQGHMRLRTSGNRDEIRQQYMPMIWDKSVRQLQDVGKESVDDVIDFMDSYFLTRDDFDAIMELGLGPMDQSKVKLETQTKATFTRLYNQRSHPLPFMKASDVLVPKAAPKEKPDIEDAIEESDEEEVVEEAKDEDDELDLKKDKYVSQPKKKAAPKKKGKKAAEDDGEEKPKKGRKPKAKA